MLVLNQITQARRCIANGEVIAYPTEAVYGLGCDLTNEEATKKLLQLKNRPIEKGLIVIIADWSQLFPLIGAVTEALLDPVKKSWPGHVTWVFPKAKTLPYWVSGQHDTVAIRMTNHPIARALCAEMPLISTSANVSACEPATDYASVLAQFPTGIDVFFDGPLGTEEKPSAIYDLVSGCKLR